MGPGIFTDNIGAQRIIPDKILSFFKKWLATRQPPIECPKPIQGLGAIDSRILRKLLKSVSRLYQFSVRIDERLEILDKIIKLRN